MLIVTIRKAGNFALIPMLCQRISYDHARIYPSNAQCTEVEVYIKRSEPKITLIMSITTAVLIDNLLAPPVNIAGVEVVEGT
jgi:hypothetical protein